MTFFSYFQKVDSVKSTLLLSCEEDVKIPICKAKFGHEIQEIELTCDVYENTITPKAMGKERMSMLRVTFENPQVWILKSIVKVNIF